MRVTPKLLAFLFAIVPAALFAGFYGAKAEDAYPDRPITMVVTFTAGGSSDVLARAVAAAMSQGLGKQMVVDNRPGAGGHIGAELVAHAPPDGYTVLFGTNGALGIGPALYKNLRYDPAHDLVPVGILHKLPLLLMVNPSVPAKTVPEFIAYVKANPGKVNMASAGTGGIGHLAGELLNLMAGTSLVHVPYRGNGPALAALLGGEVEVLFPSLASSAEFIRSGKLRGLAVTSAARSETLPDIPTVGEFVPGYEISTWYGLGAPKGTPVEVIDRLSQAIDAGLADPKIKAQFAALGDVAMPMPPDVFGKFMAGEVTKWGKVIRAANIKAE